MWWVSGGVLLSRPVSRAVPWALAGLASGFGMGPGVSLSLWPPVRVVDAVPCGVPPVVVGGWGCPLSGNRTVDAFVVWWVVLGKLLAY